MAEENQVNIISEGSSQDSNSFKRFFTTKNIIILGVVGLGFAVIFAVFYYLLFAKSLGLVGGGGEEISQKTTEGTSTKILELEELDDSKQGGLATVTEIDGKTSILVELDAVLSADEQPANIYKGSCSTPGNDVEYKLDKIVNGESETILKDDIEKINNKKPLAIAVGKSFEEENVIVSCANL